jgi:two-component system, sensor histidine kinase YesM
MRLLVYLVLMGSISLLCATLLFYRHSSVYTKQELSVYAEQIHAQLSLHMERSFRELDRMVSTLTNDYAIQRLVVQSAWALEDTEISGYIEKQLRLTMEHTRFIESMCLVTEISGRSFCVRDNQAPLVSLEAPETPLSKGERLIMPLLTEEADQSSIRYIAAIYDNESHVAKGMLILAIRLDRLMEDGYRSLTVQNHSVYDGNGTFVYHKNPVSSLKHWPGHFQLAKEQVFPLKDYVVTVKNLQIAGTDWFSLLELPSNQKKEALGTFHQMAGILFIAMVLISLISTYVFSRMITQPIQRLKGLMKRAEHGDLKAYWLSNDRTEMNDLGESYNQMLNRLEELIKQVKREESLKKEAEIAALQYQLTPHFLYNTLNTIKWVAKIHKTPQISEAITALVQLLQASLGKRGDFLTMREELELLQAYMAIQRFRYGDRISLELDVDPLAAQCLVPRMILQPLVENAIIHGIEPSGNNGEITIRAWLERDMFLCQVENTGVRYTEQEASSQPKRLSNVERMSGIGLAHIRQKIKLYYGDDYKMYVYPREHEGTVVRMNLPIHQSEG